MVLDRRIQLKLSQELVAAECGVVQGEVQAWEAGTRIPTSAELDALARILDLDRHTLAGAETGSAVHRNELSAEQQAELDTLYWHTDTKIPDLAARFGLQGRSIHKLVTAVPAGMRCQGCGEEMVFATRGPRRIHSADCPTCRRARILASIRAFAPTRPGLPRPRSARLTPARLEPESPAHRRICIDTRPSPRHSGWRE